MKTGIFIRARNDQGHYASFDLTDPALPKASLAEWLNTKDQGFLIRLVEILLVILHREEE